MDKELQRLHDDLDRARWTIIELLPEPVQGVLESFILCRSKDGLREWRYTAIARILELAEVSDGREMHDLPGCQRAYCPLCGRSAQSVVGSLGFAYPEGLDRHLNGRGNTIPCAVFQEVWALARAHLRNTNNVAKEHSLSEPVSEMHENPSADWVESLSATVAAASEFTGLGSVEWRYSPPCNNSWGCHLLEFAPALLEIVERGPEDGEVCYPILHNLDLVMVQSALDDVAALAFGIETDAGPCITLEGQLDGEEIVLRVYTQPFEDAEITDVMENGAMRPRE